MISDPEYIEPDPNPGDEPSFTFIAHNDDLQTKRIRDAAARKQIRSHVMRDVRRRERIAGLRRPSKKERSAKNAQGSSEPQPSPDAQMSIHGFEDEALGLEENHTLVLSANKSVIQSKEQQPRPGRKIPPNVAKLGSGDTTDAPGRTTKEVQNYFTSGSSLKEPGSGFCDPFGTLPDKHGPSRMIDLLLKHCVHHLFPSTFHMEKKNREQLRIRVQAVMHQQINDGAAFYGVMAISAAHRALQRGSINQIFPHDQRGIPAEREYFLMHDLALRKLNQKLQDPRTALEFDTIHSVAMLVGAALFVGHFNEMRTHLDGLIKMTQLKGILANNVENAAINHIFRNINIFDVKAAEGLGSRPRLALPVKCEAIEDSLRQRIEPSPSSDMHKFAQNFRSITVLSPTLVKLLEDIKDIYFLEGFNFHDAQGLTSMEHEIFRWRGLTIEHGLLDYAYEQFLTDPCNPNELHIPFVEGVVRLAALRFLCFIVIYTEPNTGLGRAFINQSYRLFQNFTERYSNFSIPVLELLTWVVCINIEGARGQREEGYFKELLRQLLYLRRWHDWSDFEESMKGFLYWPRFWSGSWRRFWDNAQVEIPTSSLRM